jgi:hypothetical protein
VVEYVYGIVGENARIPEETGIAGQPLRLIGDGPSALVSHVVDDELRFGREEMVAHARVLENTVRGGATVLPMRFGIVMTPEEVHERLLEGHGEELRAQLAELAGKVELSVRVMYDNEAVMREIVSGSREIAALRERVQSLPEDAAYYDRIRLGELVAHELDRRREADAAELLAELETVSLGCVVGAPAHERVVLNASFLVGRDDTAAFDATLERQAEERHPRMHFRCVGPLPPHSFVDLAPAV